MAPAGSLLLDLHNFAGVVRLPDFNLAAATERELLLSTQGLLRELLAGDRAFGHGPTLVRQLLHRAGVSPSNPGRAEMIFRTEAMSAYNDSAFAAMRDPELGDSFPVWQYAAVVDFRSRPAHAARDGRYYPASMPFAQVRGTAAGDVINCRCTFLPIFRDEWADLRRHGARLSRS